MPEFQIRYLIPASLDEAYQVDNFRRRVESMAMQIQAKIEEIFQLSVVWEAREFERSRGMSDFSVTAWVTDNDNAKTVTVLKAQDAVLTLMSELTFEDETVDCWFQRVKGKWGSSTGTRKALHPSDRLKS